MFRDYDSWKLDTPPRFEDTPMNDPADEPERTIPQPGDIHPDIDEDGDSIDEPTPLITHDGDHVGGGPVGETTIIPVSDMRRDAMDTFYEGAD